MACTSSAVDEEQVEVVRSSLVINQANVFGFEDPTHWTSTVALSSSTTHTQGSKSLGVKAKGYTEVTSAALPSLTGVTGMIGFDMLLPTAQPNPFWYGLVQVLVSVPSKGVNNLFVGQVELTGKPLNQFFPVDFNLPQSLITTLAAGGYSDFKVKLVANVPSNATGTYLFDNMHFLAGAVGAADLVETNILQRWSFGAVDPSNTTLSVLGVGQTQLGQAALRAVTNTGSDFWLRYDAPTPIDIGTNEALRIATRALNTNPGGWQTGPVIVIEDATGARMTLSLGGVALTTTGTKWLDVRVPLAGGLGWARTGTANLHNIRAIEVHVDTWEAGFTLDVDAIQFTRLIDACSGSAPSVSVTATARATTARLTISAVAGAVGYDVYRSLAAGAPVYVNRSRGTTFDDSRLSANTTYRYEVRPVMAAGCESGSATVNATTAASAAGLTRIPTLNVLVPIYINADSQYTAAQIVEVKAGIELARQFYFRNTRGRLNLALTYLELNVPTPPNYPAAMPDIEADLRGRGFTDNQYDAVYVVARNVNGCYGGMLVFGRSGGSVGTSCGVPYPANVSDETETMAWVFTHEFQHTLDMVIAEGSGQDMIHGHPNEVYNDEPYSGPVIDGGEHFDWERTTLRTFTAYGTLASPFNDYLEVDDPDGDGLASNDARLPMDEARFGSNANLADTEADGLNDLGEYSAGVFASSSPLSRDSDGDGQNDNVDPTPRQAIAASMTAATPIIDGVRDAGYTIFRFGLEFSSIADFTALTSIAYDANAIYIYAEQTRSDATLRLLIDGSGANGFFAGDDSYSFTLTPFGSLQNWTTRHSTEGGIGLPIPGAQLFTRTLGAVTIMEAKIPRTGLGQGYGWTGSNTNGFSTAVGSVLGFRILFTDFGTGELFGEPWATQNEYFHFDDVTLR